MSVDALRASRPVQQLLSLRRELDDLQLQLGTGRKANTYAGLGALRQSSLDARAKLSSFDGFKQTIDQLDVRVSVMQAALTRFMDMTTEQRGANLDTVLVTVDERQSTAQKGARQRFEEAISLLNQEVDGRRLFSGRATDVPATRSPVEIMEGSGSRMGLRGVIEERVRADRGVPLVEGPASYAMGRLAVSAPGAAPVTITDGGPMPFGFDITGLTSFMGNLAVTDDGASPRNVSFQATGQPRLGETMELRLALPTGRDISVRLTASLEVKKTGDFQIGATPAATTENMRTALLGAIDKATNTELRADSTLFASDRFFDVADGRAPQRVDIVTTPETATAVRAGTPDDTVHWYTADGAADDPRTTSVARVDTSVRVAYGARANEQGIRRMVSNLAAFAAVEFDLSSEASKESYSIMALRVRDRMGEQGGQTVSTIKSELVVVEQALKSASERQQNATAIFANLVADIEGVDKDEVATRILELQTRLQASYQTTALISRLSLVQYLS
jgi:flagellar hook-associated protein 3 FlgL